MVDLGIALAKVACLIGVLIHGLNDSFQILLCLDLQDVISVVFHALFLLVDRFEQVSNLLNGSLVFSLDRADHVLFEELGYLVCQVLKCLYILRQNRFLAAVWRRAHLFLNDLD